MGYTNVYVYDEGIPGWVKKGYPTESDVEYPKVKVPLVSAVDLKKMMETRQDLYIVDLRDKVDRKSGWIKSSTNIPIVQLQDRYQEIPQGNQVILLDLLGKQTYIAAKYLASQGYQNLHRLDGGFLYGWIKAGYHVEK